MRTRRNLLATIEAPGGDNPLIVSLSRFHSILQVGVAASGWRLVGSGGTPPYAFSIPDSSSGDLPPGLTLNPDGSITGTPTTQGSYPIIFEIQDSASGSFLRGFNLVVQPNISVISFDPVLGEIGHSYRFAFKLRDGGGSTTGFAFAVTDGSVPAGLTLHSSGVLDGMPTGPAGTTWFTVEGSKAGQSYSKRVSLTVQNELFADSSGASITPVAPPAVRYSTARGIRIDIDPTVGIEPFKTEIVSGALPDGLTVRAVGRAILIEGVPTETTDAGAINPILRVTDSAGATADVELPIVVGTGVAKGSRGSIYTAGENGDPTTFDFFGLVFGLGNDGDIDLDGVNTYPDIFDLSGGVYSQRRDVFLNDAIVRSGVVWNKKGFAVYGNGSCDISNADAGSIIDRGVDGTDAINQNGGAGAAPLLYGSSKELAGGGDGGTGTASSAANGSSPPDYGPTFGGTGYTGASFVGAGGTGTVGGAGVAGNGAVPFAHIGFPLPFGVPLCGQGPIGGSPGGQGGGSGGADGSRAGGGGGGGAGGSPTAVFHFREIITGPSTPAGVFQIIAGIGGNGGDRNFVNCGAGGGGFGAPGGYWHIVYAVRTGDPVTGLIWADGGDGGTGGNNTANAARVGNGGGGGYAGSIEIIGVLGPTYMLHPDGGAPSLPVGRAGGTGGQNHADF